LLHPRFPPPWELDACFVVTDNTGQKLASISRMSRGGDQRRSCSPKMGQDRPRIVVVIARGRILQAADAFWNFNRFGLRSVHGAGGVRQ